MRTIEITDEQYEAWERGESIRKPEKWEPAGGRYFISIYGQVQPSDSLVTSCQKFGMEYQTRELAERARDMMRAHHRLVAYAMEHWPDYDPEKEVVAYFPVYDRRDKEWYVSVYEVGRNPWVPYGPYALVQELVRKLNNGEVVL